MGIEGTAGNIFETAWLETDMAKQHADITTTALRLRDMAGVREPQPELVPYAGGKLVAQTTKATPIGPLDNETMTSLGMDTLPEGLTPEMVQKLAVLSLIWAVKDPDDPPDEGRLAAINADVYLEHLGTPLQSLRLPMLPIPPIDMQYLSDEDLERLPIKIDPDKLDELGQLFDAMYEEELRIQEDRGLLA